MSTLPFSIIVPVYNDDSNLPRCLDSIISQTFTDFECLLIDDGSTDNSSAICDVYAQKDSRIRLFHKNNEGISKTRQFGINNSTGRYTIFVDSDDWIEHSLLQRAVQAIDNAKADIIFMDFYDEIFPGKERYISQKFPVSDTDAVIRQVLKGNLFSCLWNVIIKRDLYFLNNISFTEGINYGEDSLFVIELLLNNPKIELLNGAYYHHTFNPNSFTRKNRKKRYMERNKFLNHIPLLLEKYNRLDLCKYNFFPINDKYAMLCSGIFSRKEYKALFSLSLTAYHRKNCGFRKYILLSLAETGFYSPVKFFIIFVSSFKNKLRNIKIFRDYNILINGDFLCRRLTGIERYAYEIIIRLDKISKPGEIALIIPHNTANLPAFSNLKLIRHKKNIKSHLWWQMITLQWFLITHRQYTILEYGNTALPFAPGIVFLHDIYCEFFPEDFSSRRDKVIRAYNRWQYRLISRKAKKIVTVSFFTRNQIIENFRVDPAKITVIYSSWEHFRLIDADYSVFDAYPALKRGEYFFSLGSLSKRKNIKWITEYAKKNPDAIFAISGVSLPTVKVDELYNFTPKNIILLGYLDDSKVKALMERCKAFILPSYYEGFGLTPLEALSCGAQIIVAKAASLPEIYGNTAHYIDPYNTDVDLDELLREEVDKPDGILAKYSYDTAAAQVYKLIREN